MDRRVKRLLLAFGVVTCLLLVAFISKNILVENDYAVDSSSKSDVKTELESGEAVKITDMFIEESENIVEMPGVIIKPDFIQKKSIKVILEDVYLQDNGEDDYDLYFKVFAEDRILDEALSMDTGNFFLRTPSVWTGALYLYKGQVIELFLCESGSDGRFWYNIYCVDLEDISENYFGQKIRLVYTLDDFSEIKHLTSLAIYKDGRSFLFDVTIPKEFYSNYA